MIRPPKLDFDTVSDLVEAGTSGITSVNGDTGPAITIDATDVGAEAADNTLTALAGLNSTPGIVVQTAVDTFTKRTLTEGTGISITNGNGASGNPTISINNPAVVTVSSSTATLAATDVAVEVTTTVTNITLPSASAAITSKQIYIHNGTSNSLFLTLTRASSDTIDGATSRAGFVLPGRGIWVTRKSSSTWTSTLDIDPRAAFANGIISSMDSSSANLTNGMGWTASGTGGQITSGGRLLVTQSRSGSTAATGWTGGTKTAYSEGRVGFSTLIYNSAPTSNQHRWMIGLVDGWYSGTRSGWGGKGMVLQYESGDTNWQMVVRDSANSIQDTGVTVAAGYYLLTCWRDGSLGRFCIYYSATDATFANVAPTTGSYTPSAWPTNTNLQPEIYAAAGLSWTGTLGVAWAAYGDVL